MDPSSPPKRMTRARAAKANNSQSTTTSRTTTAKAKSLASATAASAKRALRAHDADDTDNDQDELGLDRPASTMQAKSAAAPKTRGRPRKTPAPAAASDDDAPPAARVRAPRSSTATASTRTSRAKTVAPAAEEENEGTNDAPPAAAKKRTTTARTKATAPSSGTTKIAVRAGSAAVAAAAAAAATTEATAPGPGGLAKKKVTFEEPEKENIAPRTSAAKKGKAAAPARPTATADTASSAAGLRAKPVRRAEAVPAAAKTTKTTKTATTATKKTTTSTPAASTAPTATRTRAAAGKPLAAIPLSPKKVTQVRMARGIEADVDSEDELAAMDEPPMLMRSPTKPARKPTNITAPQDGPQALSVPSEEDLPAPGTLRSPARRPPPTPFKDGLVNTPARRGNGVLFAAGSAVPASTLKPLANTNTDDTENNNNTVSLLASPAKRFPLPPSMLGGGNSLDDTSRSPLKMSLLQTPAKRPVSPVKAARLLGRSVTKPAISETTVEETEPPEETEQPEPEDPHDSESLTQMINNMASDAAEAAEAMADSPSRKSSRKSSTSRQSSVLPQHAQNDDEQEDGDPSLSKEDLASLGDPMDVDVSTLGAALLTVSPPKQQESPQRRPVTVPIGFGLRDEVLQDHGAGDDDSDDDDTARLPLFGEQDMPATPCPTRAAGADGARSTCRRPLKTNQLGFTPLAEQLRGWKAHSPAATTEEPVSPTPAAAPAPELESAPSMPAFSDDAMTDDATVPSGTSDETVETAETVETVEPVDPTVPLADEVLLPIFDDMDVTQEDRDLAQEANELSLLEPAPEPEQEDDAMADAGQEYNDENAIPIDPALLDVPPVTPQRVLTKTFHTVSKVPLKASDDSTPRPRMRRRSLSVSRLPASASSRSRRSSGAVSSAAASPGTGNNNSGGLTRSATVISYSPTKKERGRESRRRSRRVSSGGKPAAVEATAETPIPESPAATPTTPTKTKQSPVAASAPATPATPAPPASPAMSDAGWSTVGTPARTPRRDLNPGLLRGAVVFADVHTSEGADASGIFVDLLTQMGARCVKSWSGMSPTSGAGSGVTHVVFKDGSKRTLDKVRESQGLVQCVGVSWVLDCERENQWLDERPYEIDTAQVPRGGARRRRSMEPQALANQNGRVVSATASPTPGSSPRSRGHRMSAPSTPTNRRRRDSALWVRTPEEESSRGDEGGDGGDGGDGSVRDERDWDSLVGVLTPVPKTPAPEAIARYAATLLPATPTASFDMDADNDDDDDVDDGAGENDENADPQRLGMRTCPPKQPCYRELGEGILAREKDERVLMRLMAARRKSLQFAPKIASPLSKAWH